MDVFGEGALECADDGSGQSLESDMGQDREGLTGLRLRSSLVCPSCSEV